jgi:hypothetical protein
MAFVHEIQIVSSGFPGQPGYTNLYFETTVGADHDPQFGAVKSMLNQWAHVFPTIWSGAIAASGRVLEASTGLLAAYTTAPSSATAVSSGGGSSSFGAGVAGLVVAWGTGTINRSRLVRGKSFLVPIASDQYATDGTLVAGAINYAQNGAQGLIDADVGFGVWSRPRSGAGGLLAPVLTRRVHNQAAFLTSRRV